jgi:hypothetical protein
MALKEYIGIQRITEIFRLLKSKIDAKAELAESMTTEEFEDAENLPDGLYPIEEEDLVSITADMVKYDSGHTVEDKIDELNAEIGDLSFHAPDYATRTLVANGINVGTSETDIYTAVDDCYISLSVTISGSGRCAFAINGTFTTDIYSNGTIILPIKSGDVIKAYQNATSATVYGYIYDIR